MHPVVAAGRWVLAFFIAALVWLVSSIAAVVIFRLILNVPSHSLAGFTTGFCAGTFAGVWAGASTLPLPHRKAFSIVLCAIWGVFIVLLILGDVASGTLHNGTIFLIVGTLLGVRWIWRTLWPKWATPLGSSILDAPDSPTPSVEAPILAAPAVVRAASPARRPVGPPVFGRRR
jgi:hypothetical protein